MDQTGVVTRRFLRNPWKISTILLLLLGIMGLLRWGYRQYGKHFFPYRFYVVETGGLVRGARQTPPILRKVLTKHKIRTIVNLDDKIQHRDELKRPVSDPYAEEKAIAREMGAACYGFLWEGSGVGLYREYDRVADIMASTASRPVYVHCAAGEKRTNAAFAAYWIRHRGLAVDEVVARLKRYGLRPEEKPDFMAHIKGYYEYTLKNQITASSITVPAQTGAFKDAVATSPR